MKKLNYQYIIALGSTVDDSYCNSTCKGGDPRKMCGGSAYESVYGTGRYIIVYYQQSMQNKMK